MKNCIYLFLLCLAVSAFSCKDKVEPDPQPGPQELDLTCIKMVDEQGQSLGSTGCDLSKQWTNFELNLIEAALFAPLDTVPPFGTQPCDIQSVHFYPNPALINGVAGLQLLSPDSNKQVKIQIAIADKYNHVVQTYAAKADCNGGLYFDLSDEIFKKGTYYRLYYRITAMDSPVLYEGHGDFLICKQFPFSDIDTDCF